MQVKCTSDEIVQLDNKAIYECDIIYKNLKMLKFTEGQLLIDIGCGPGSSSFLINKYKPNANIIGIDKSKEYIDYGNSRKEALGVRNIDFYCEDASSLSFSDNYFDVAYSRNALHMCKNPDQVLAEMKRVTKIGGTIGVLLHDNENIPIYPLPKYYDEVKSALLYINRFHKQVNPICYQINEKMHKLGIKNIKVEIIPICIKSIEAYNNLLKIDNKNIEILEYTGLLKKEIVEQYNNSMLENIMENRLFSYYTYIFVYGIK